MDACLRLTRLERASARSAALDRLRPRLKPWAAPQTEYGAPSIAGCPRQTHRQLAREEFLEHIVRCTRRRGERTIFAPRRHPVARQPLDRDRGNPFVRSGIRATG